MLLLLLLLATTVDPPTTTGHIRDADTAQRHEAGDMQSPTSINRRRVTDADARAAQRRRDDDIGPDARDRRVQEGKSYYDSARGAATRAAHLPIRRENARAKPRHESMTGTWDDANECRHVK